MPTARRRLGAVVAVAVVLMALALALDRPAGRDTSTVPSPQVPTTDQATDDATGGSTSAPAAPTTTTTIDARAIVPTDRFVPAQGPGTVVGTGTPFTYTVEVEDGVPIDPGVFADQVEDILSDPRGWTADGRVALQRVGPDQAPTFRVRLATPRTTDVRCAPLPTNGLFSCRNGEDVMINLLRWVEGAEPSGLSLVDYRRYLISHEVGHALGHEHVGCPGAGQPAPVMLQQTKGLQGCDPNPWPFP